MLPVDPKLLFFAAMDKSTMHMVATMAASSASGATEVGGAVHRDYRGQGYGHAVLETVCGLLHRHFGIGRLVAGCEVTNTASQRWLAKSAFTRTPGPKTYKLPSGRVAQTIWWNRVDPDPRAALPATPPQTAAPPLRPQLKAGLTVRRTVAACHVVGGWRVWR